MAQCYCCLLSKYPNVDTGRRTVSAQLLNRRRRLRDYKQPLISRVQTGKSVFLGDDEGLFRTNCCIQSVSVSLFMTKANFK